MKKKTARRWLSRNSWKIAQRNADGFVWRDKFVRQFLKCIKEVKRNG